MKLDLVFATLRQPDWRRCIDSWSNHADMPRTTYIIEERPLMEAYNLGLQESSADIIGYLHDDVLCAERGWDARVMREFENSDVGLVGFGGSLGFADPDIYRKPYELSQLSRRQFRSNMREAEVHGERFTGECNVAALDGFALFVRRKLLNNIGGWPIGKPVSYFLYDAWLCCEAVRHMWDIRLVGVSCDHLGGKSTGMGREGQFDFQGSHEWLYNHYRDVLPIEANQ